MEGTSTTADEPRRSVVRRLLGVLATFDTATPTQSLTEIAARESIQLSVLDGGAPCTPPAPARCCWPAPGPSCWPRWRRRVFAANVEPDRLCRALRPVRDEKVAFSREEMALGACSVASPVTSAAGHVVAVVSIVAHSSVDVDRLAFAVRTAASGISRQTRLLQAVLTPPDHTSAPCSAPRPARR